MILPPKDFREMKARAGATTAHAPLTDRLPQFLGGPEDAARTLSSLSVMLVGAGSVGGNVAAHFARLGVKQLLICDPKLYKSQSLLTQFITPKEVGKFKAASTAKFAKSLSPATSVSAFNGPAQQLTLDVYAGVDVVVLATDNLTAELAVAERCLKVGTPLVQGSVHGESLTVQVRFVSHSTAGSPSLCCQFGQEEFDAMSRERVFSCEGHAQNQSGTLTDLLPTMSVSALCSLAGDLTVLQILRWRLGLGVDVTDTQLEYNAYTHRTVITPLRKSPNCRCPHETYTLADAQRPLRESTLRDLASTAAVPVNSPSLSFIIEPMEWIDQTVCRCAQPQPHRRFAHASQAAFGLCHVCGEQRVRSTFHTHRQVPTDLLGDALAQPLRALGAADAATVLVRHSDRAVLFCNPTAKDNSHEQS